MLFRHIPVTTAEQIKRTISFESKYASKPILNTFFKVIHFSCSRTVKTFVGRDSVLFLSKFLISARIQIHARMFWK